MSAKFVKTFGYLLLLIASAVTVNYADANSQLLQALTLAVFALGAVSLTIMMRKPRVRGSRSPQTDTPSAAP